MINPCNGSDFQRWNLNGRQLENVATPGRCLTMPVEGSVSHLELCRDAYIQHWSSSPTARSRLMLVAASPSSPSSATLALGPGFPPAGAAAIRAKGGIAFRDRACRGTSRPPIERSCVDEVAARVITVELAV